MAKVVERYLAELELRARPRVAAEARATLARIVGDLDVRLLRDVTKAKVVDWRAKRAKAGAEGDRRRWREFENELLVRNL